VLERACGGLNAVAECFPFTQPATVCTRYTGPFTFRSGCPRMALVLLT
jgi:hypothetical protein